MDFRPMTPDEIQRTMQFLLEHQAQFAADFEKLSAKIDGLADSVGATKEAVNGLTTIVGHTVGLMGELTVKMGRWAEQSRRTDEKLDLLTDESRTLAEQGRRTDERLKLLAEDIRQRAELGRLTDARLDRIAESHQRLADLFERHMREDHDRPPS